MRRLASSPSAVLLVRGLAVVSLILSVWGYFSPWVAPKPAGLQLSGHDLVEWLTFVQSVQDGTFPVSRFDMSLPLALAAVLAALTPALFLTGGVPWRQWLLIAPFLGLAIFCGLLVLPPYPFVLTAYADPELQPQFWLAVSALIAAVLCAMLAWRWPRWATAALCLVAVGAVVAAWHACTLAVPPIADALAKTLDVGYGVISLAVGAIGLFLCGAISLWRSSRRESRTVS